MLASVLTLQVRDRWRGVALGCTVVAVMLALGLAAYQEVDLAVYTDLPESMRALMNIPDGADVAALAYGVMYNLMGAMTLAGLALSVGASAVAGEERDGTIGLLLANPRSRVRVLAEKIVALVVLATFGAVLLLVAASLVPGAVGVDLGSSSAPALVLHLWANALFWGMLALAVGAATGNRTLASGLTAGLMVLSYVTVGFLPLINTTTDLVQFVPWYWFDGSTPFQNGVDTEHLGLLLGGAALFSVIAFVRVDRRDLRRSGSGGVAAVLDRLRNDPRTARLVDRLTGATRVTSIRATAGSEGLVLLSITAGLMFFYMGVIMGPIYTGIQDSLSSMMDSLPQDLLAFAGGGDMSTPEGWFQTQTFGLMAPIAVMVVTISRAARALAGEEQDRTMGLLLANPVPRSQVVVEKAIAMAAHAAVVGFATFAGVSIGILLAGLEVPIRNVAATSVLVTLLGVMFGAVALALGAATGRARVATMGAIGVAGVAYVGNSLLTIADSLSDWAVLSPFHWYLGTEPLVEGMAWGWAGLFVALTIGFVALSTRLFERRDLRRT